MDGSFRLISSTEAHRKELCWHRFKLIWRHTHTHTHTWACARAQCGGLSTSVYHCSETWVNWELFQKENASLPMLLYSRVCLILWLNCIGVCKNTWGWNKVSPLSS